MQKFLSHYIKGDKVIWLIFLFLFIASILAIFSTSSFFVSNKANYMTELFRQGTFLIIGTVLALLVHRMPFRWVRLGGYLLLPTSIILLLLLFFVPPSAAGSRPMFGVVAVEGAARWISFFSIQFQPSELAKIALIICMSDLLTVEPDQSIALQFISRLFKRELTASYANALKFWICFVLMMVFCLLVYKSNISTTVLMFLVGMALLFISNVSLSRFLMVAAVVVIGGGIFIYKINSDLKSEAAQTASGISFGTRGATGKARIINFLEENDENRYQIKRKDASGKMVEYYQGKEQVVIAQIAIARGGLLGLGPGKSLERNYLSHAYDDFIFAIILEEYGLVGALALIMLYLWLLYRAGMLARQSTFKFPALLVIGLSLMIVVQAFISMGVATHLGPVTGQPLPLISRGGTSIVITCLYLGIIQCVARNIYETSPKKVESGELKIENDEETIENNSDNNLAEA